MSVSYYLPVLVGLLLSWQFMADQILSSISYDIIVGVTTPPESWLIGLWVPHSKNVGVAHAHLTPLQLSMYPCSHETGNNPLAINDTYHISQGKLPKITVCYINSTILQYINSTVTAISLIWRINLWYMPVVLWNSSHTVLCICSISTVNSF